MTWFADVVRRRLEKKYLAGAAVMLVGFVGAHSVSAQGPPPPPTFTQFVTTLEDHDDGSCSFQDCTLREAVNAANANADQDYIEFAGGLIGPITLQSELPAVTQKVQILNYTGNHIAVLGTGRFRLLSVEASPVSILRVDFVGGRTRLSGAGVTVRSGGVLTLSQCEISQNFASDGAGIFNNGQLNMLGCSIEGNNTSGSGAGLLNLGTATLTNCTVSGNNAGIGARGSGGGIYNTGTLNLKAVTLTQNNASETGGGLRQINNASVANSIFAKNSAPQGNDVFGDVTSSGYNLIGDSEGSNGFGAKGDLVGTSSTPVDPKLEALNFYGGFQRSHRPAPDSPVLDSGNRFGLTTDQRGKARPVNLVNYPNASGSDGSDIGAFELQGNEAPTDSVQDGTTLIVNTSDDKNDGACTVRHCSLREAINAANKLPGANVINFDIPGTGVQTIKPVQDLPVINTPITIDGSSQPGFKNSPLIEISGAQTGGGSGLYIGASNCTIKSLVINSFGFSGIEIFGERTHDCVIQGCYIGTNATGSVAGGPQFYGIFLEDVSRIQIGGTSTEQRNVISGNSIIGVVVRDSIPMPPPPPPFSAVKGKQGNKYAAMSQANANVIIQGNYIGTDRTGLKALGNGDAGIMVSNASANLIGGTSRAERNVISGNAVGVRLAAFKTGVARDNRVQGNYIGTDKSGNAPLGNRVAGVVLQGCENSLIGGAGKSRNLICDSYYGLVAINYEDEGLPGPISKHNHVENNSIGVGAGGGALGNVYGVYIADAQDNVIGGPTRGTGNLISGNGQAGVYVGSENFLPETSGNAIQGNNIGIDEHNTHTIGNSNGIILNQGVTHTLIGGSQPYAGNVITGNYNEGIFLYASDDNTIQGNYIGTDATGEVGVGNDENGIHLMFSSGNLIGGGGQGEGNVVSYNASRGIFIEESSEQNAVQGNIIGADANAEFGLGNGFSGVRISDSAFNLIGGQAEDEGNLIVNNGNYGVAIQDFSDGNVVASNDIEANEFDGVIIDDATDNTIYNNGIFDNYDGGVFVLGTNAVGNAILQNEIAGNSLIGIDLQAPNDKRATDFITPNDLGDADKGPNNLQNFPVLREFLTSQSTFVRGTLNSRPNRTYLIEFFVGGAPVGKKAQADQYLGSIEVRTDGSGNAAFTFNAPKALAGKFITATATSQTTGDTSELAKTIAATVDKSRPQVAILKTSGLTFGSTVHLEGTARDIKGITSVKVRFEQRQSLHGPIVQTFEREAKVNATQPIGTPQGTVSWSLDASIPPGFYKSQAIATNVVGNTATSAPSNLVVLSFGR